MAKTYSEKLKDPRWQKKRLEIFLRDNWTCLECGDACNTLHVHHTKYFKNIDPWDYDNDLLETLCSKCHSKEHAPPPCEIEPGRKYGHLLIKQDPDIVLTTIKSHTEGLLSVLKNGVTIELETEILKNIIFLQKKRKEYLNG